MASHAKCADRVEDTSRELTDEELECVAAGKELGGRGQGSNASRGWYGAGYGNERGYDSYGTHIG